MDQLWARLSGHRYTRLPLHSTERYQDDDKPSRRRQLLLIIGAVFSFSFLILLLSTSGAAHAPASPPDSGPHPEAPLPPAFELHRPPRPSASLNVTALKLVQDQAFKLTGHNRPTCPIHEWHLQRYETLKNSNSSIFIALNLINNANVSPNILQELPVLLHFLGPHRVHVSVYENGSDDETPQFLVLLAEALDALGTSYSIVSRGKTEKHDKGFNHRIEVIAAVRNAVLRPLYDNIIAPYMPNGRFDEVLIMNDVIWCTVDVLEVLYQKQERGAHEACSVDWDWNARVVYDRWVLRAMSGRPWYDHETLKDYFHDSRSLDEKPKPRPLPEDPADHDRFVSLLPLQVFACWNGMAVFSSSVFLEHGIRFRGARSDHDEQGNVKEPSDIASECYLTSVDMWKQGIGKIVLASRARVAYSVSDYDIYRTDGQIGELGPDAAAALARNETFEWVSTPPAQVAMHDFAWWENPERWAPWDEP